MRFSSGEYQLQIALTDANCKNDRRLGGEKTGKIADLFQYFAGYDLARFQLETGQELKRSRTAGDLALQTYNWPDEKKLFSFFYFLA